VRRVALAVLILALAVGAYVVFGRGAPTVEARVPEYAASPAALPASAPFELVLKPASAAPKIVAYAFGVGDREPNPLDAPIELLPEGVVRLKGSPRALVGAREARVVIGTSDSIHRFDDALARAKSGVSDASIRVVTLPITR
jgi:hypothetical protein